MKKFICVLMGTALAVNVSAFSVNVKFVNDTGYPLTCIYYSHTFDNYWSSNLLENKSLLEISGELSFYLGNFSDTFFDFYAEDINGKIYKIWNFDADSGVVRILKDSSEVEAAKDKDYPEREYFAS